MLPLTLLLIAPVVYPILVVVIVWVLFMGCTFPDPDTETSI